MAIPRALTLALGLALPVALAGAPGEIPRPEHPKPQFRRDAWMTLNGRWRFRMDEAGAAARPASPPERSAFDRTIVVPFCPESALSGIAHTDFITSVWYERDFVLPAAWKGNRVFLHFGGADYESTTFVNGKRVGTHVGGSVSFAFEITRALREGENRLAVHAFDDVRGDVQCSGKQSMRPESFGVFYTRVTGIWQTVWLEARPQRFIERVHIVPDLDGKRFVLTPAIEGAGRGLSFRAKLLDAVGKEIASASAPAASGIPVALPVPDPRPWSPRDPHLYGLRFELLDGARILDAVESYAGLRKFQIEGNRFFLNGEPIFLRFVLDQGFYPDGIWTAPSDAALRRDIELSMAAGFNGARLHQKVFEERFHYWADRLGYLTWAEFADWGGAHSFANPVGILNLEREWREAVLRDRNHPSIVAWTPLNETRGAAEKNYVPYSRSVRSLYAIAKALDPTRPVNDASGYVHVLTDIFTVHDYDQDPATFRARYAGVDPRRTEKAFVRYPEVSAPYEAQPYVVDEYGGTFWTEAYTAEAEKAGKGRGSRGYGKTARQVEDLVEALTDALLENPEVAGFTYTQLTDVEQEVNGVYTYDRKPKFDIARLKGIFGGPAAIERGR
ncbi:MAG: hypothetical protein JXP34_00750 [Planctomycetes bacterium]|nr:hypothetical protein [Planctomycetota bacterium]